MDNLGSLNLSFKIETEGKFIMVIIDGSSILVTGGTGSFGKHFIRTALTKHKPRRIVFYSRDELKQFEMQSQKPFDDRATGSRSGSPTHAGRHLRDGGARSLHHRKASVPFSMEPGEFREKVSSLHDLHSALEDGGFASVPCEMPSRACRRSLSIMNNIKPGEKLTPAHVRAIRPGNGLPPHDYDAALAVHAKVDIARGTLLSWDLISKE
jgi:hypothetical protein